MSKDLFPKYLFLNEGSSIFDEAVKSNRKLYHLAMDMIRYGLEVTDNYVLSTEELTRQFKSHREKVKSVYEQQGGTTSFHLNQEERDVCTFFLLLISRRDGRLCMTSALTNIMLYCVILIV